MKAFFDAILYEPLLNLLIGLYNTVAFEDLGVAIILLTAIVRLALFPLFQKSIRHQAALQAIQPKIKEVQEKHKHDKTRQTEEMFALYKREKVNPFSGMFFLIIQLPILIALYRIFLNGVAVGSFSNLYSFVASPEAFQTTLFGLINLNERSILMVVVAAILQYIQGKLALPVRDGKTPLSQAERVGKNMVIVGPLLTLFIFFNLPAAVGLYWTTTSLFSIGQQLLLRREQNKNGTT